MSSKCSRGFKRARKGPSHQALCILGIRLTEKHYLSSRDPRIPTTHRSFCPWLSAAELSMTDSTMETGVSRTWRYIRPRYSPMMPSSIALMLIDRRMSAASVVKPAGHTAVRMRRARE